MHPNLAGVTHDFINTIRDLHQEYPNIYVVTPESSVDSYTLMEHAQKVISFGSTTGLEAAFRKIPVILLGKGIYYYSNVAYIPENKDGIENLLISELKPKPLQNALKFGFYFLKGGKKQNITLKIIWVKEYLLRVSAFIRIPFYNASRLKLFKRHFSYLI